MTEPPPSSMFSIGKSDQDDEAAVFPSTDPPHLDPHRSSPHYNRSSPNLWSKRGKEARFRTESHSDTTETDTLGDLHVFRSRSRSAPSSLLVAARYGRELRRMSDEFDQTFKGLPRPKSASAASELTVSKNFRDFFTSFFGRRKTKGKTESETDKQ